jgi:hypothetical protein
LKALGWARTGARPSRAIEPIKLTPNPSQELSAPDAGYNGGMGQDATYVRWKGAPTRRMGRRGRACGSSWLKRRGLPPKSRWPCRPPVAKTGRLWHKPTAALGKATYAGIQEFWKIKGPGRVAAPPGGASPRGGRQGPPS